MRILVTGAAGMLGHKMLQRLAAQFPETYGTIRNALTESALLGTCPVAAERIFNNTNLQRSDEVERLLTALRPDVVVNCAGLIKQRPTAHDAVSAIELNALLPHKLAALQQRWAGRLIHFSTDCVFSGRRGAYHEEDPSDAEDLYGRTKALGEVTGPNALTLRTSIVGRELSHFASLLEWLIQQSGRKVKGFARVYWSGVTTNHLADLVARIIAEHPSLNGLYQVSSRPISKYELLRTLNTAMNLDVEIEPDESLVNDRTLSGERLRDAISYVCPSWQELARQLAADPTPYNHRQGQHAVA